MTAPEPGDWGTPPRGGWDDEPAPHQAWVDSGHCSVISWAKSWCNAHAGHKGIHWSPYLMQNGHEISRYFDDQGYEVSR